MTVRDTLNRLAVIGLCASLGACLVGPNYRRPAAATATTPVFKEAPGWTQAQPSSAADHQDWWTAFGDPTLNALEAQVITSNQTVAAAGAAYREATAIVRVDRAALFPTISATGSVDYSASPAGGTIVTNGTGGVTTNGGRSGATYNVGLGGSWAPDLFGGVRRNVESARETAQSQAAALANARLAAESELAMDYIQLRQQDEEIRLLDAANAAYAKTLQITQNKYNVGVSAKSDLLTARSQLESTQAQSADLVQSRARLEHAIAVLTGQPPAALTLDGARWRLTLPDIPAGVPSTLLQRRPDIAQSERAVAAANAQIGVQIAAYFPSLNLTGSGNFSSTELGSLFNASSFFYSLGASAAETLIDFGARRGRVAEARAAYDQTVATYRQTVLSALQQVEDDLAAQRVYRRELALRKAAAEDASAAEVIAQNQYNAGQVDFTTVVVAQTTALNARTSELQIEASQLATAVDLIAALGGGWNASELPAHP
jgi:NodT family efflux transporter outer membrane factor (OMF) lipoprotein